jgi:outer membrane protein assembly factor BamB
MCYFPLAPSSAKGPSIQAIKRNDGKKAWKKNYTHRQISLVASNEYIWVSETESNQLETIIHCYRNTGEKIWQKSLYLDTNSELTKEKDALFVVDRNELRAIDAKSGSQKWAYDKITKGANVATGQLNVVSGLIYICAQNDLVTVDRETEKIAWHCQLESGKLVTNPPSVVDGTIYISSEMGVTALSGQSTNTKLYR